jgi:hypothetical protein
MKLMPDWNWWLNSNTGLYTRIAAGCSIFAFLATIDLFRHGRSATRWREYSFLLLAVGLAMAYGAINDAIASHISWEYFYYGKGISQQLGPTVPPDPGALQSAAIGVGLKATWSAGLIVGVALLIANNPRTNRPRLPYRTLIAMLISIFVTAAIGAASGSLLGNRGALAWTNSDIAAIARDNLFRPIRFMSAYGMNLGGYAGGLLATASAITWITARRKSGQKSNLIENL